MVDIYNLKEGDIIDNDGNLNFNYLYNIPNKLTFINNGWVALLNITKLSPNVIFNNTGLVYLNINMDLFYINFENLLYIYSKIPDYSDKFINKKDLLPLVREFKLNKIL